MNQEDLVVTFEQPILAVNGTGGITLANTATRETLALWIVKHQREEHALAPPSMSYAASQAVAAGGLAVLASLLAIKVAKQFTKKWKETP